MRGEQLELTGPEVGERLPVRLSVEASDGGWTPGPHVLLEAGNDVELTLEDLQWLRDEGIPAAIAKLTAIKATREWADEVKGRRG